MGFRVQGLGHESTVNFLYNSNVMPPVSARLWVGVCVCVTVWDSPCQPRGRLVRSSTSTGIVLTEQHSDTTHSVSIAESWTRRRAGGGVGKGEGRARTSVVGGGGAERRVEIVGQERLSRKFNKRNS